MDWQGLLKWSLQHQDGTKKSEFKAMDKETMQWLTEAFEHYSVDEIKRMREIVQTLMSNDYGELPKISVLEELEDILDSLDRARDFCTIGAMSALVEFMFTTPYPKAKILALRIFTSANQNNPQVQESCAQLGAIKLLQALQVEKDIKVVEQMTSALSAYLRGEYLTNKIEFLKLNGLDVVQFLANEYPQSTRVKEKLTNILNDLILYQEVLKIEDQPLFEANNVKALLEALQ